MQAEKMSAEPAALEALRDRIEAWRGARPRTRAMPEALWNEAAVLAREVGVYRVAHALKLSFDTLKRRVGSMDAHQRGVTARALHLPTRTDFVEVKGLADVGISGSGHDTVVEVVACDGARLSIRLKCASADVAALIHAFRGRA
jgi:hypothetical protein